MGVETVPVPLAVSLADTLEVSCHSPSRVLLPFLEHMEGKRHTSCRSYSTNVNAENQGSAALTLQRKTAKLKLYSL